MNFMRGGKKDYWSELKATETVANYTWLTKERIIIATMTFNKIDKRINIGPPHKHTLQTRRQTSEENKIYEKRVKSVDKMTSVFIRTRLLEYDNQIISDCF